MNKIKTRVEDALLKLAFSAQVKNGGFEERKTGSCFEFLGIDVLIDDQLGIHVMEVNVGPEVYSTNPQTHRVSLVVSMVAIFAAFSPSLDI